MNRLPTNGSPLLSKGQSKVYSGNQLTQIAFPIGGIGAGTICLNGQGGLQDFSIRHRPALTAVPDSFDPADAAFALLHIKNGKKTRLIEGPFPEGRIYAQGIRSQGYRAGGFEGLPRFRECTFQGEYPFGQVSLTDPDIPLDVTIIGFNPFIPLDSKNSGIPCAILEYTLTNCSAEPVEYQFSYHLSHLAMGVGYWERTSSRVSIIPGRGLHFFNAEPDNIAAFGSASLSLIGHAPTLTRSWVGGGWFDAISVLWKEASQGYAQVDAEISRTPDTGRSGGSVMLDAALQPGESITYPVLITWHFPNVPYTSGNIAPEMAGFLTPEKADPQAIRCWRPYYATQWKDALAVEDYVQREYASLRQRTQAFHDALYSTTVPEVILEAVSANLGILKSPTILWQADGNLWGWEGCFHDRGSCAGSCTHVWNYAQSIPHLFPELEQTLREQEYYHCMNAEGHINFRSALPTGPNRHTYFAASDGQLGGVMKVYREWQINADLAWLKQIYPYVKRSLDYCIATWDPKHEGVLREPHHNTYDIEFWGPDGMCSSFYLGALVAMAHLAKVCGNAADASLYETLAQKGAAYLDERLFNGEYYEQETAVHSNGEQSGAPIADGSPKYQYGSGCLSDGVVGVWLAEMCGLEHPLPEQHVRKNLESIFKYNFKQSLWEHANTQRPGYALGNEPGLVLCTWPKGNKPTLPFVYCDEVWTGIEYQVASHLILNGYVQEGLTIVHGVRSRYDGYKRNPWNEYESGNYYARAMASFALLPALSGFSYSKPSGELFLKPQLAQAEFTTFFCTASGWGTLTIKGREVQISLTEGALKINAIHLTLNDLHYVCRTDKVILTAEAVTFSLSAEE